MPSHTQDRYATGNKRTKENIYTTSTCILIAPFINVIQ